MRDFICKLVALDQKLEVTVSKGWPLEVILIDVFLNHHNIDSKHLFKHTYRFATSNAPHYFDVDILDEIEPVEGKSVDVYTIDISQINSNLDSFDDMYIVSLGRYGKKPDHILIDAQMPIYSSSALYRMRLALMSQTCDTCHDDSNYKTLEVMMFREIMFRESSKLGLVEELLYYWHLILSMFKRNIKPLDRPSGHERHSNIQCSNGKCTLISDTSESIGQIPYLNNQPLVQSGYYLPDEGKDGQVFIKLCNLDGKDERFADYIFETSLYDITVGGAHNIVNVYIASSMDGSDVGWNVTYNDDLASQKVLIDQGENMLVLTKVGTGQVNLVLSQLISGLIINLKINVV